MNTLLSPKEARKQAETFLGSQYFMSLATTGDGGTPHVSVLLYLLDDDLNFYFITHGETRKVMDLRKNPSVAGEVHSVPEWYIQFHGTATELKGKEADDVMERFAEKALTLKDLWPPFFMSTSTDQVAYKITPSWLRLMGLSGKTLTIKPAPIYTIIGDEKSSR